MLFVITLIFLISQLDVSTATDDNRIVGGRPALIGEFPYQVSLRRSYNKKHFCGGTLISDRHVLSAAHCMYYMWGGILPPVVIEVVAGQLNATNTPATIYRNVSSFVIHPDFNKTTMDNDVTVLTLTEAFDLNDPLISTVALRNEETESANCFVTGWGVSIFNTTNISDILMAAEINIIRRERCKELYGNNAIRDSMICAGVENGERDACQGDSGGPLVCAGYLTGVVSTGKGCASPEYPGIYANVPYLLDWIEEHANLNNRIIAEPQVNEEETEFEHFMKFLEELMPSAAGNTQLDFVAVNMLLVVFIKIMM